MVVSVHCTSEEDNSIMHVTLKTDMNRYPVARWHVIAGPAMLNQSLCFTTGKKERKNFAHRRSLWKEAARRKTCPHTLPCFTTGKEAAQA